MKVTNLNRIIEEINVDLSDCLVISCQHILNTNRVLFDALIRAGLDQNNLYIIGKAYSSNKSTYESIKRGGIHVDSTSLRFNSHKSFDEQFEDYISHFLKDIVSKVNFSDFRKVIIVDDGGQLLLTANDIIKDKSNLVGVEQTSSGYEKIKEVISFPVVNVARSKTKLTKESPLIAELIVKHLHQYLKPSKRPNILIVGQGPIGQSIYKILYKKYKVSRYDKVIDNSPFPGKLGGVLTAFDIIIGCTGKTIITPKLFKRLKKEVVLASASSSDREFPSAYLRSKFKKSSNPHEIIRAENVVLLNSGFPVNFTGGPKSLPLEKIILTRALMFLGIAQASGITESSGVQELSDDYQRLAVKLVGL